MAELKDDVPATRSESVDQGKTPTLPQVERRSLQRMVAGAPPATDSKQEQGSGTPTEIAQPAGAQDPLSALASLGSPSVRLADGLQRCIFELQDALDKLTHTREAHEGERQKTALPTQLGTPESWAPAVGFTSQLKDGAGSCVDPVRQVAIPEWVGRLIFSSSDVQQQAGLSALAQYIVHAGLTPIERSTPEVAVQAADDCIARLIGLDARTRERALVAVQTELDRRRQESFIQEIRSESEARATIDRVIEHTFFSVEDSLPGLELFAHTAVAPGELRTQFTETRERTFELLCEEALARSAAGEQIPVSYLLAYADAIVQSSEAAERSSDLSKALQELQRRYTEGLLTSYRERYPLAELHKIDLALAQCTNLEGAFAYLEKAAPGGDRQLFANYALSTVTSVAAAQHRDVGLLVGQAAHFRIPLTVDSLAGRLNNARVMEHARLYNRENDIRDVFGYLPNLAADKKSVDSEVMILLGPSVPAEVVPEGFKSLAIHARNSSPTALISQGSLRIQATAEDRQRGIVKGWLDNQIPQLQQPVEIASVISSDNAQSGFFVQKLNQFTADNRDTPLQGYTRRLLGSVEWVQRESVAAVSPAPANPFQLSLANPLMDFNSGRGAGGARKETKLLQGQVSMRPDLMTGLNIDPVPAPNTSHGVTLVTREYATLALYTFEQRVRGDFSQALASRDLFKLEEVLQVVSEAEPRLRAVAGQPDALSHFLYQDLTKAAQQELKKDIATLPAELPATYRALGLGFRNELCKPQDVQSSLTHLAQLTEFSRVLEVVARRGSAIQELRTVHDTPASPSVLEGARGSRLEALYQTEGRVSGRRHFVIDTHNRIVHDQQQHQAVEVGPGDSPQLLVSADTSLGTLCKSIFRSHQPTQADLLILLESNPQWRAALEDGSFQLSSILPAGSTVALAGTPLGFQIQQAAVQDRLHQIREELRVCREPEVKPELEHYLRVTRVFDSLLQREGAMATLQRQLDHMALELDATSEPALGNAERLCALSERDLKACRDALFAERKRAAEVEAELVELEREIVAQGARSQSESDPVLTLVRQEIAALQSHRRALAGAGAQSDIEKTVCRSPATALGEIAADVEHKTQGYAERLADEQLGAVSTEGDIKAHADAWSRERTRAFVAARRSSSPVCEVLLSLGDLSNGNHTKDADLNLRRASFVFASAGERALQHSGAQQELMKVASEQFFAAGRVLIHATYLPGSDASKIQELRRAAGDLNAKALELRAAHPESPTDALKDLGSALSWLVADGDSESKTFAFSNATTTEPHYLDSQGTPTSGAVFSFQSQGHLTSWGIAKTEIAALSSKEVDRLARSIAELPEGRRARALQILSQVIDQHCTTYERNLRDATAISSRDAAYRALQVASKVPTMVAELKSSERLAKVAEAISAQRENSAGQALNNPSPSTPRTFDTFSKPNLVLRPEGNGQHLELFAPTDREDSARLNGMRARFLLAFADSSDTQDQIAAEIDSMRAAIQRPAQGNGRTSAQVMADIEAARTRQGADPEGEIPARLQQELLETQAREARLEALRDQADSMAISVFTQLASNTKSGKRDEYANRVSALVDEVIARDERDLKARKKQIEQVLELTPTERLEIFRTIRAETRSRHADLYLSSVHAFSAAGRFDLAEGRLKTLKQNYAGEMSPATAKVIEDIETKFENGSSMQAALEAALNEAQTGGSMTQSLAFGGGFAATGAGVGFLLGGPLGAGAGLLVGGLVGLVADKGTNVYRGWSRIRAAGVSGVSGIDGQQTTMNLLTFGVDAVTVWLPLKGGGSAISQIGVKNLARGALNRVLLKPVALDGLTMEARRALSNQLAKRMADAGVRSANELGEGGVRTITNRLAGQQVLHRLADDGGRIIVLQAGTAAGNYGYSRYLIQNDESLTEEQRSIALKHLNQETAAGAGICLAFVAAGGAVYSRANRSWFRTTEKLTGVNTLAGPQRAAARGAIQQWGAENNLLRNVPGVHSTRANEGAGADMPASEPLSGAPEVRSASRSSAGEVANADRVQIYGDEAIKELTKLRELKVHKDVTTELFKRWDNRGNNNSRGFLFKDEIDAARQGIELPSSGKKPPSGDSSGMGGDDGGGGGGGGGSPEPPQGGGGRSSSSRPDVKTLHDSEISNYSPEFQDFLRGRSESSGTILNSLGSSRVQSGGTAILERPISGYSQRVKPSQISGAVTKDSVRSSSSAMEATISTNEISVSKTSSVLKTEEITIGGIEIDAPVSTLPVSPRTVTTSTPTTPAIRASRAAEVQSVVKTSTANSPELAPSVAASGITQQSVAGASRSIEIPSAVVTEAPVTAPMQISRPMQGVGVSSAVLGELAARQLQRSATAGPAISATRASQVREGSGMSASYIAELAPKAAEVTRKRSEATSGSIGMPSIAQGQPALSDTTLLVTRPHVEAAPPTLRVDAPELTSQRSSVATPHSATTHAPQHEVLATSSATYTAELAPKAAEVTRKRSEAISGSVGMPSAAYVQPSLGDAPLAATRSNVNAASPTLQVDPPELPLPRSSAATPTTASSHAVPQHEVLASSSANDTPELAPQAVEVTRKSLEATTGSVGMPSAAYVQPSLGDAPLAATRSKVNAASPTLQVAPTELSLPRGSIAIPTVATTQVPHVGGVTSSSIANLSEFKPLEGPVARRAPGAVTVAPEIQAVTIPETSLAANPPGLLARQQVSPVTSPIGLEVPTVDVKRAATVDPQAASALASAVESIGQTSPGSLAEVRAYEGSFARQTPGAATGATDVPPVTIPGTSLADSAPRLLSRPQVDGVRSPVGVETPAFALRRGTTASPTIATSRVTTLDDVVPNSTTDIADIAPTPAGSTRRKANAGSSSTEIPSTIMPEALVTNSPRLRSRAEVDGAISSARIDTPDVQLQRSVEVAPALSYGRAPQIEGITGERVVSAPELSPSQAVVTRQTAGVSQAPSAVPLAALPESLVTNAPRLRAPTPRAGFVPQAQVDTPGIQVPRGISRAPELSVSSAETHETAVASTPMLGPSPLELPLRRRSMTETSAPAEIPIMQPLPEVYTSSPPELQPYRQRAELEEQAPAPFDVAVPSMRPSLNAGLVPELQPQPAPEPQPLRSRVAQATEEGKRKRESDEGYGSDIKREEDKKKIEERKEYLLATSEAARKRDKRRSGRRFARRVVAGEIGSFTVDEEQVTKFDAEQFTSGKIRTNEGMES